jgi:nitrite reductase/ring-hydroxylating ferredoxin subunit
MPIDDPERVLEQLESADDSTEVARLLTPVLEFHHEAIRRVLEILGRRGQKAVIDELLADPLVGSLLRGYGLDTAVPATSRGNVVPLEQLLESGKAHFRSVPLLHRFELGHGDFFKVQFFDEELLLCNVEGHPFAFKNRCPESGGPLDHAELRQFTITCPCHHQTYDLRTGESTASTERKLEVMPVTVEDGVIRVNL